MGSVMNGLVCFWYRQQHQDVCARAIAAPSACLPDATILRVMALMLHVTCMQPLGLITSWPCCCTGS